MHKVADLINHPHQQENRGNNWHNTTYECAQHATTWYSQYNQQKDDKMYCTYLTEIHVQCNCKLITEKCPGNAHLYFLIWNMLKSLIIFGGIDN